MGLWRMYAPLTAEHKCTHSGCDFKGGSAAVLAVHIRQEHDKRRA